MLMNIEYVGFPDRQDRVKYVADRFGKYLAESVLDVGCDRKHLKKLVPGVEYLGVDMSPHADMVLNLEKLESLPFETDRFGTSICLDVLEHLDNLHFMFSELLRVSKNYVIISLPNNWANARRPIDRGHGGFSHYGLPFNPPADRHKWFFSLEEAINFVRDGESAGMYAVEEMTILEKPRPAVVRALRSVRYPRKMHYLNRYAHNLFAVLKV